MKRLHDKVNVIPLIAKADTLTPEECQLFKKQVCVWMCWVQVGVAAAAAVCAAACARGCVYIIFA